MSTVLVRRDWARGALARMWVDDAPYDLFSNAIEDDRERTCCAGGCACSAEEGSSLCAFHECLPEVADNYRPAFSPEWGLDGFHPLATHWKPWHRTRRRFCATPEQKAQAQRARSMAHYYRKREEINAARRARMAADEERITQRRAAFRDWYNRVGRAARKKRELEVALSELPNRTYPCGLAASKEEL